MNELDRKGIKLVNELYKDLYKSSDVMRKVSFKHVTEKQNNVKYYFDRLDKMHLKKYLERIKEFYYDRYIIKEKNIVNNIYELEGATKESIINTQKETLSDWIDYLSDKSLNYPTWAKYILFQTILKIGTYNEANNSYYRRDEKTTADYIPKDPQVVDMFITYLIKYVNKDSLKEDIKKLLDNKSLDKLLIKVIEVIKRENNRNSNDGIWKEYRGYTKDYIDLVNDIKNYNVSWCIKDIEIAKSYTDTGDFYIYYTKDNNGGYKVPRIAIKMNSKHNVGEIRGASPSQNLEEGLEDAVLKKLKEMNVSNIEDVLNKIECSRKLTLLNQKNERKEEFTEEELCFIYELDNMIETFAVFSDPRKSKIINSRSIINDYNQITDYKKKGKFLEKYSEEVNISIQRR